MSTGTPEVFIEQPEGVLACAIDELKTTGTIVEAHIRDWWDSSEAGQFVNLTSLYRGYERKLETTFQTIADDPFHTDADLARVFEYWLVQEDSERVNFLEELTGNPGVFWPAIEDEAKNAGSLASFCKPELSPDDMIWHALTKYHYQLEVDIRRMGVLAKNREIQRKRQRREKIAPYALLLVTLGAAIATEYVDHKLQSKKSSGLIDVTGEGKLQ